MHFFWIADSAHGGKKSPTLVGWGIDGRNPEAFMAQAEAVGFDVLITTSNNPVFLSKLVEIGRRHNIAIFACITPESFGSSWKKKYPGKPLPLQKMTEAEDAALKFITAGKNRYMIPYQWGGEPILADEVLAYPVICPGNFQARELLKPVIDEIIAIPGIGGIAFDGFGYQNYHRCHCADCVQKFREFSRKWPELSTKDSEILFFRDTLVDCINGLADYVRSKNADMKTAIHVWPVFAPEPLYGNRLNIDFCGQTAAWYTLWTTEKIASYSSAILTEAQRYYPRQQGVCMIGYYDRPGEFPVKNAARVDMELRIMIEMGCGQIQVCDATDVIKQRDFSRF